MTFLLETVDLLVVESVFVQHLSYMLTVERRAGAHLARCGRELHEKPERLRIDERLQHVVNHKARPFLRAFAA